LKNPFPTSGRIKESVPMYFHMNINNSLFLSVHAHADTTCSALVQGASIKVTLQLKMRAILKIGTKR
jgi:hypothetical protein